MGIFQKIGILGRSRAENISETLKSLVDFLNRSRQNFAVDTELEALLKNKEITYLSKDKLAKSCDLFIVVGGDGSLLHAAKLAAEAQIPVVGINKGRLGFLTDILPADIEKKLKPILAGIFVEERRFFIEASIQKNGKAGERSTALNDVVLLPGNIAHMIEFEIYINKQFVCKQRADGLIVASPTGSTAYALSGGGPILHPQLEAFVLVPMFPHTLSSRPLVVQSNSLIEIVIPEHNETTPWLSCDGNEKKAIERGSALMIEKKDIALRLIHPEDYDYFETLRSKLHWSGRLDTNI